MLFSKLNLFYLIILSSLARIHLQPSIINHQKRTQRKFSIPLSVNPNMFKRFPPQNPIENHFLETNQSPEGTRIYSSAQSLGICQDRRYDPVSPTPSPLLKNSNSTGIGWRLLKSFGVFNSPSSSTPQRNCLHPIREIKSYHWILQNS